MPAGSGAVNCVPLTDRAPVQAPEASQLSASADSQLRRTMSPASAVMGRIDSVAIAARSARTSARASTVPPGPVHASPNDALAVSAAVVTVPCVARAPDQPPDAVQVVALVADHSSCAVVPTAMAAGVATSVTTGNGCVTLTVTCAVTLPPAPLQASVNVVACERLPLASVPVAPREPVHPPVAVQAVALVADQVSVTGLPAITGLEFALSDTVGAGAAGGPGEGAEPPPPPPPQAVNQRAEAHDKSACVATNRVSIFIRCLDAQSC